MLSLLPPDTRLLLLPPRVGSALLMVLAAFLFLVLARIQAEVEDGRRDKMIFKILLVALILLCLFFAQRLVS